MIDQLERQYGANTVREGGLKVYTTIDPRLQRLANKAISDVLPYKTDPAAAIVSVEPGTGAIRAMTAVVRTKGEPVQPRGAVDAAGRLDVQDVRARLGDRAGRRSRLDLLHVGAVHVLARRRGASPHKPWEVHTYENTYSGSESVTRATLQSDNTVYAQLTLDVGPRYVWQMAHRLGIHMSPDTPVASIGLGSLVGLAARHGGGVRDVPGDGRLREADGDHEGVLPGGKVDTARAGASRRRSARVSQGVAWKVNDVLQQNAQYGTGAGSGDGVHP